MITKKQIIKAFIDEGLSLIECERITNSEKEFREALHGLICDRIEDSTVIYVNKKGTKK